MIIAWTPSRSPRLGPASATTPSSWPRPSPRRPRTSSADLPSRYDPCELRAADDETRREPARDASRSARSADVVVNQAAASPATRGGDLSTHTTTCRLGHCPTGLTVHIVRIPCPDRCSRAAWRRDALPSRHAEPRTSYADRDVRRVGVRVVGAFGRRRYAVAEARARSPALADDERARGRAVGFGDENFILAVGTIEPRKNLATLLRAFELLARDAALPPDLTLVLAGRTGWLHEDFLRRVASSALRGRVRFAGYVTDAELCALYSRCRVFAYPSLYEGFGLPPLEAMACGAPVVASRIPAHLEVLGEVGRARPARRL